MLGQPIIIENQAGGAAGSVGADYVARAALDGHTLLCGTQGVQATNLTLYLDLRYDPLKNFAASHAPAATLNLLVSHPAGPGRTWRG